MSKYITTKEEFLKIKQAWSKAVNSKKAKPEFISCDEYRYDIPKGTIIEGWVRMSDGGYGNDCTGHWVSKGTGVYKKTGWIHGSHHMLYNIIRNKPLHTGFTELTSKRKLNIYESPYHNFYDTVRILKSIVHSAKALVKHDNETKFYNKPNGFMNKISALVDKKKNKNDAMALWALKAHVSKLQSVLEPFDGVITYEMISRIDEDALDIILRFDRQDKPSYLF